MNTQIALPELTDLLFARAYAYDILRRYFIEEPTQDYVKVFVQQRMIENFPFKEDSEGIAEGIEEVKHFVENMDLVHNQENFDNLHWDYTRMMIGPFELAAPPWESIYVQKEPLLFQECTMDVRKNYRHFGFKTPDKHFEADDHIGLELDFLYHLNHLCQKSAEEGNLQEVSYLLSESEKFLNEHLLVFAPEFSKRVIDHADTPFYKGMAKILQHYLLIDSQFLKELLNSNIIH